MWTDHLLFWVVLIWMLLLSALTYLSVRALLRANDDTPTAPSSNEDTDASPTETAPPAAPTRP